MQAALTHSRPSLAAMIARGFVLPQHGQVLIGVVGLFFAAVMAFSGLCGG